MRAFSKAEALAMVGVQLRPRLDLLQPAARCGRVVGAAPAPEGWDLLVQGGVGEEEALLTCTREDFQAYLRG